MKHIPAHSSNAITTLHISAFAPAAFSEFDYPPGSLELLAAKSLNGTPASRTLEKRSWEELCATLASLRSLQVLRIDIRTDQLWTYRAPIERINETRMLEALTSVKFSSRGKAAPFVIHFPEQNDQHIVTHHQVQEADFQHEHGGGSPFRIE